MAEQSINTERVAISADMLRTVNGNLNTEFDTLNKKAKRFEDKWKSAAGTAALTVIQGVSKISEERSKVVDNYVAFLEKQVNPDYVEAETVNTTLADKFK